MTETPRPHALWPGLAVLAVVGLGARGLHRLLPAAVGRLVSEILVGIVLGLLLANLLRVPTALGPGLQVGLRRLLPVAIVLLGARLSFSEVLALGFPALGLIAVVIATALATAHAVGRLLGLPRRVSTLLGVGASICGNTAIAATAPAIAAEKQEVALAIAVNTLLGTALMLALPLVGRSLGLPDGAFGFWAGSTVPDTAQVVATGFSFSDAAGDVATVVKLTRNASMVGVVLLVGFAYARAGAGAPDEGGIRSRLATSFPTFLLGFFALAALNSLGALDAASAGLGVDAPALLDRACRLLLLLALTSVALGTDLRSLAKTGLAPFWTGLATVGATTGVSLALVWALGLGLG